MSLLLVSGAEIHGEDFDSALGQLLGLRLGGIASEASDAIGLVGLGKRFDDAAALDSSRADNGDEGGVGVLRDRH